MTTLVCAFRCDKGANTLTQNALFVIPAVIPPALTVIFFSQMSPASAGIVGSLAAVPPILGILAVVGFFCIAGFPRSQSHDKGRALQADRDRRSAARNPGADTALPGSALLRGSSGDAAQPAAGVRLASCLPIGGSLDSSIYWAFSRISWLRSVVGHVVACATAVHRIVDRLDGTLP
mmetsp:Transcript_138014/g.240005  ORF Transcript_138014/g.240005 Transcript_138014/m.240005 type:complete len:177 (+) Transcript_138014:130-660(+)